MLDGDWMRVEVVDGQISFGIWYTTHCILNVFVMISYLLQFSNEHDEDFKIEPWTLMQDRVSKGITHDARFYNGANSYFSFRTERKLRIFGDHLLCYFMKE